MDKYTQQVIKHYADLIEINDWETFYIRLKSVYNNSNIGQITEILLEAGIDPLKDLDYIPENYLAGSDLGSFTIPEHIKIIEEYAFNECQKLKIIYFPNSLEIVKFRAFRNCHSLEDIYILMELINNFPILFLKSVGVL